MTDQNRLVIYSILWLACIGLMIQVGLFRAEAKRTAAVCEEAIKAVDEMQKQPKSNPPQNEVKFL